MRRHSDRHNGERTGAGRRARDRILTGQAPVSPTLTGRPDLENLILFLGDDLRESALALGGIEGFLVEAQRLLEKSNLAPDDLRALVDTPDIEERMELLWDALSSLRRSMAMIQEILSPQSCYRGETLNRD